MCMIFLWSSCNLTEETLESILYKFNPLLVPHYLILSKSIELSHYHYASHACYVTGRWYLVGQAVTWNLCPISTRVQGQFRTILLVDVKVTRTIKKKVRTVPWYKHLIGHGEIRQRSKEGHAMLTLGRVINCKLWRGSCILPPKRVTIHVL